MVLCFVLYNFTIYTILCNLRGSKEFSDESGSVLNKNVISLYRWNKVYISMFFLYFYVFLKNGNFFK